MEIDLALLRSLEDEHAIPFEALVAAIEHALLQAYLRLPDSHPDARVVLDQQTGVVTVWAREPVVGTEPADDAADDSPSDTAYSGDTAPAAETAAPSAESSPLPAIEETAQPSPTGQAGSRLAGPTPQPEYREWDDTPENFGRVAAQTARQVIRQRLRQAQDDRTYGEFHAKEGDVLSGVVQQSRNPAEVVIDLGPVEGQLPKQEQVPGESYRHGDRLRCYVYSVRKGMRELLITLSRTHPGLVRGLFSLEVPEIADGTVEVVALAREAGHRTKMAVRTENPQVNAKGACIGPMGSRVRAVMSELHGEKIDIVDYSDDPARFVAEALSPAKVTRVEVVDLATKTARVFVPEKQMSLAIGKQGQNARLAARLTGWRIDIHDEKEISTPGDRPASSVGDGRS